MAAGVVPQSSWSLSPIAPAATCSRSGSGRDDAPVVKHKGIRNDEIEATLGGRGTRRLAHAVADDLAAAELDLVTVDGEVLLHLYEDIRVREPDAISHRGSVEIGVLSPRQ